MKNKYSLIEHLPDNSGVYLFKKGKEILYIGKATSLKDRVKSYYAHDIATRRGPLIVKMLTEADCVEYEMTDSVLEALIREAALIKKYQPPYNVREKDDKSWNWVVITDEEYPRVFTMRGRELPTTDYRLRTTFGPFPHGSQLKEALKIVRRIFPFRGINDPTVRHQKRTSFLNIELGLAPDLNAVSKKEYQRTIRNIRLFFEGRKKKLVTTLENEMKTAAKRRAFETAAEIRHQLFALQHIQDVALLKHDFLANAQPNAQFAQSADTQKHSNILQNVRMRIEAFDVAHTSGKERIGVMTVIENDEVAKTEYRTFNIRSSKLGDTDALKELLERRLKHDEWSLPRLVVVDGGVAQKNAAEKVLNDFGYAIPVVAVVKDERHRPKGFLGDQGLIKENKRALLLVNHEAHRFSIAQHRRKRGKFF